MKKSLIALAVASAFAAPAVSMAAVTINGELDTAIERVDNGDESWNQGNNTHSRFWIDSSEDVGAGTKVKAHLEFDMGVNGYHGGNAANGGNGSSINNRNSYIGLQGDSWGEFRFGTQEGIFEATGYNVDAFHGAAGPGGNIVNLMGQTGLGGAVCNGSNLGCRRLDSTLTYISPNWNGFSLQVDYSLEGPTGTAGVPGGKKWNELQYGARYDGMASGMAYRIYGAGIQVKNADLVNQDASGANLAAAGGTWNGLGAGTDSKDEGIRLGGGITWEALTVDFIYENLKWKANGSELKHNTYWLQGSYAVPTGKLIAAYTWADKSKLNGTDIPDSEASNIALGYYHTLSKNASLYLIYDKLTNKQGAGYNIQDTSITAAGKDPSAIAIGMYYLF